MAKVVCLVFDSDENIEKLLQMINEEAGKQVNRGRDVRIVKSSKTVKSVTAEVLQELSINSNIKGFNSIVESVFYIYDKKEFMLTGEVLFCVAEQTFSNKRSVERTIRHAISIVYSKTTPQERVKALHNPSAANELTAKEFLCVVRDEVCRRMED